MPATITRRPRPAPLTAEEKAVKASPIGAVVRCDRTGRVYAVEGVLDGGASFIVQNQKTKKEYVTDENGLALIVTSKVTILETMNLIGGRKTVTRIH